MKAEGSADSAAIKSSLATVVAGLSLLVPASMGIFFSGVPRILHPFPAMTAIPSFLLSSRAIAVAVPSLVFLAWNPGLFRGASNIPKRSHWLLVVAIIISIVWFGVGWENGLRYQGARYVYEICVVNVAEIAFLAAVFSRYAKRRTSFGISLTLHWLLFVWLAWYALPYLGELP
jgi:hypothetical protein